MDRIWLRFNVSDDEFEILVGTLQSSVRSYRHAIINFKNEPVKDMNQLAQIFATQENLKTLMLTGMDRIEPQQLLVLLTSVPNLKQLYLLGEKVDELQQNSIWELPKCDILASIEDTLPRWAEIFNTDEQTVLPEIKNVCLTVPKPHSLRLDFFRQIFPNLNQLQLTGNHPSLTTLFATYKDQLEKVSILTPSKIFFFLFCDISFPNLTHLYLDRKKLHSQMTVAKCINFFKNPAHSGNLRQLTLHHKFMVRTPIFLAICSNCLALRELQLSLDYMDGDALKEVTRLTRLQKLTLHGTAYFRETPRCPSRISALTEVKLAASRFPISLLEFIADIAPNLDALAFEDIENPEEVYQILPTLLGNIRHLELGYSETFERPPSCHPSGFLRNMSALETCSLRRVLIKHGIQGWLQDAPHLGRVSLASCRSLTDTHLVILTTQCPKLRQLELKDCAMVTDRGVEEFKSRIPLCKVDCD